MMSGGAASTGNGYQPVGNGSDGGVHQPNQILYRDPTVLIFQMIERIWIPEN